MSPGEMVRNRFPAEDAVAGNQEEIRWPPKDAATKQVRMAPSSAALFSETFPAQSTYSSGDIATFAKSSNKTTE